MPPRKKQRASATAAPSNSDPTMNPKLATIVSRFEKSMQKYEHAVQVFNEDDVPFEELGPDNDPGVPVDAQAKKTLAVIKKALSDAINLAAHEVAAAGGDVDKPEIKKLFADITKLEQRAVDAAYGNSFEWDLGGDSEISKMCDSLEPYCEPIVLAPIGGNGSKIPAAPPATLPLPRAILEARCEVTSDDVCSPNEVLVSASKVFVSASGGWKNRDPILHVYSNSLLGAGQGPRVGLTGLIRAMALDGVDDLVAVADDERVKTYRDDLPVHTMSSGRYGGPLAFVEGGKKLLKAGRGSIAVWDLDGLATHGDEGGERVGGKIRGELDTMRDQDGGDEIERSVGSSPTSTSPLDPSIKAISSWTALSSTSFICASNVDLGSSSEMFELDLATGQSKMRFFGHGGTVAGISVADGRPNEFVTACSDGVVRLYDIRCPKPTISFGLKDGEEPAYAAAFADVGGQPFVFLGGTKSEQISAFDARVPGAACYSLATGNNHVQSLAWQASTQSLWAATECLYVDRMGNHHDYRAAKLRNPDAGSDEEEEDDDDDDDIAWPSKAYHRENAFGHPFDAGEHRLYRYQFKDQANPKIVPAWGQATVSESHGYGW